MADNDAFQQLLRMQSSSMGGGGNGVPLLGLKDVDFGFMQAHGRINESILKGGLFGLGSQQAKGDSFLAKIFEDFKNASQGVQPAAEAVQIQNYAIEEAKIEPFNIQAPQFAGSGSGGGGGIEIG